MIDSLKKYINKYKTVIIVFFAFFTTIGININLDSNITFQERFSGNSIFYIIFFVFLIILLKKIVKIKEKRLICISFNISIIFALIETIACINIYYTISIPKIALIKFIAYVILFYSIVILSIDFINKKLKLEENNVNIKHFFIIFGIILVFWIPYLLKFFPGIASVDSIYQIYQAIGKMNLNNSHPVCHTGIIYVIFKLFNFNGDYNIPLAIYTIFQMVVTDLIYTFSIYYMLKRKLPKYFIFGSITYFALNPVMAIYGITVWKDILFSAAILLYTIGIYELIINSDKSIKDKRFIVFFIISMILTMILKHNGFYIVFLSCPFVILALRKYWKKISIIYISIIILYYLFNNIALNALNVAPSPPVEALSIPVQQIARVVKYNGDNLSSEEKQKISKFFTYEKLADSYNPRLADPVKACFKNEEFSKNKMEFITFWVRLFFKYPKIYINSFLANTYGYWYPEASYWMFQRTIVDNDIGLTQNRIINMNLLDEIVENRNIPIISMIFSLGFMIWICIILIGYLLYKKQYKKIVIFLPVFILWLTAIASSVFCEYRYLFGLVVNMPILISTVFNEEKNTISKEQAT